MLRVALVSIILATSAYPAWSQPVSAAVICRAAIAAIMGRKPEIIQVVRTEGDVQFLTYTRPSDKKRWSNRCRVEGNTVVWAEEPGRWRNDPSDEKVSFEIANGTAIKITEDYGDSKGSETFELSRLR